MLLEASYVAANAQGLMRRIVSYAVAVLERLFKNAITVLGMLHFVFSLLLSLKEAIKVLLVLHL
eukprot:5938744-Alexandrium_andersonii.AAC.1